MVKILVRRGMKVASVRLLVIGLVYLTLQEWYHWRRIVERIRHWSLTKNGIDPDISVEERRVLNVSFRVLKAICSCLFIWLISLDFIDFI